MRNYYEKRHYRNVGFAGFMLSLFKTISFWTGPRLRIRPCEIRHLAARQNKGFWTGCSRRALLFQCSDQAEP